MDAALTAQLQIALIASLAFHRLKGYGKLVDGAINAAAAPLQSLLCAPSLSPPCAQIYIRYTRGRHDLSNTLILKTPKINYRLNVLSIMSLCMDFTRLILSYDVFKSSLDKHPEMML